MYQLDENTNDLLTRIRSKLETELSPAEVVEDSEDADVLGVYSFGEGTVDLLGRIKLEMEQDGEAAAGESGADNVTDVEAALDLYLDSIVERLMEKGASEDDAVEFIFLMADECMENGELPPMPGEDASDDEASVWMGTAKTAGFTNKVLSRAGML